MSIRLSNSCFVHIPRTGGMWFGEVVERLGLKHQKLKGDIDGHFKFKELPPNWRALKGFGFVRNPWDWVKSRWTHALENNVVEDFRHYGIHREFDECVTDSFEETVRNIVSKKPGLVGRTYLHMLEGVSYVIRTEDLPLAAAKILQRLENISDEMFQKVLSIPKTNSTSQIEKYQSRLNSVPDSLKNEFIDLERSAFVIWNSAKLPF